MALSNSPSPSFCSPIRLSINTDEFPLCSYSFNSVFFLCNTTQHNTTPITKCTHVTRHIIKIRWRDYVPLQWRPIERGQCGALRPCASCQGRRICAATIWSRRDSIWGLWASWLGNLEVFFVFFFLLLFLLLLEFDLLAKEEGYFGVHREKKKRENGWNKRAWYKRLIQL